MKLSSKIKSAFLLPQVGFRFPKHSELPSAPGKNIIVTGANSGVGLALAKILTQKQTNVTMICRNQERGVTAQKIVEDVSGNKVELLVGDMSSMKSVRSLARSVGNRKIDAIIHNAGALLHRRETTAESLEITVACHVAGPYLLNHLLAENLSLSETPRVIYMSSGGMYSRKLNVDELFENTGETFDGVDRYAHAKRAQVELVETLRKSCPQVSWYATHPGWVDTPGVAKSLPQFYRITKRFLRTPTQGADSAAWLALTESPPKSGSFVFDRRVVPTNILPDTLCTDKERKKLLSRLNSFSDGAATP